MHDRERIKQYLIEQLEATDADALYLKSRQIADDIDLTPTQVGHHVGKLKEHSESINIDVWANDRPVTWQIKPG